MAHLEFAQRIKIDFVDRAAGGKICTDFARFSSAIVPISWHRSVGRDSAQLSQEQAGR
jgi:hypothetical protein